MEITCYWLWAKEEALSRKEILGKVEKWMAAREEESWLEKYNKDDNRYHAGRGAHLKLKRAEKARALVNKLPVMVDTLASKILAWENDKGIMYDGEQKKHHGQLLTEQEVRFGLKPSPIKNPNAKKAPRLSYCGESNRRVPLGIPIAQARVTPPPKATPIAQARVTPSPKATPNIQTAKKNECINQNRRKDDRSAPSYSVQRRGPNMVGTTAKQHSSNELAMERKPFSPISPTTPSKSNTSDTTENLNRKHNELWQKLLTINRTPPRSEQENRTPQKTMKGVNSTPSPMQTARTPASIKPTTVENEMEYSFEGMRARCLRPMMNVRRAYKS